MASSSVPRASHIPQPRERRPAYLDRQLPPRTPGDVSRTVLRPKNLVPSAAPPLQPRTSSLPTRAADHDKAQAARLRRRPSVIGSFVAQREQIGQDVRRIPLEKCPTFNAPEDLYGLGFSNVGQGLFPSSELPLPLLRDPETTDCRPFQTSTPLSNHSLTPSLVFTDSPSAISHTQTPLSLASYSPDTADSSPAIFGRWHTGSLCPSQYTAVDQQGRNLKTARYPKKPHDGGKTPKPVRMRTPPPELAHLMLASGDQENTPNLAPVHSPRGFDLVPPAALRKGHHNDLPQTSRFGYRAANVPTPLTQTLTQERASPPTLHTNHPKDPPSSASATESRPGSRHSISLKQSSGVGLFLRRHKLEPDVAADDPQNNRASRKGPTAGTGHEGYGRYTPRRRSGTSANRSPAPISELHARRISDEGSVDTSLDTFLTQRLEPVYLRGEGPARVRTSESTMGDESELPVFGSPATAASSKSSVEFHQSLNTADDTCRIEPSQFGHSYTPFEVAGIHATVSDFGPSGPWTEPSDLGQRPSTAAPMIQKSDCEASREGIVSPRRNSISDSLSSSESRLKKMHWLGLGKTRAATRWNPFHKGTAPLQTGGSQVSSDDSSVSPDSEPKQLAHYAIFDSSRDFDFEELQSIMEEADRAYWNSRPARRGRVFPKDQSDAVSELGLRGNPIRTATEQVPLPLSSSNSLGQGSGEAPVASLELAPLRARSTRLPQVGRIPRVVSRRDRTRQMPAASFSRPFGIGNGPPTTKSPAANRDSGRADDALDASIFSDYQHDEFLSLSPRKSSDISYSSSSGQSWYPSTISATAIPRGPDAPLTTDEVWEEYDELIDTISATYGTQGSSPSLHERPSLIEPGSMGPSLGGIRSQLQAIPSQSFSMASVRESVASSPKFSSLARTSRHSMISERSSLHSHESRKRRRRGLSWSDATSSDQAPSRASVRSECIPGTDPTSMANLRFGALMVSKWLSFGRVLFSPAHYELMDATTEERILVIDGLGKDWSYYCALTYANASVYSIGPWAAKTSTRNSLGGGLGHLPNYRHFMHPNLNSDFPFPRGFFSVVVFRFPAITSDRALQHAISECKRVLRPGGYIEVSTLDLDLSNMGNRARRVVRELKTKIHEADPSASLKSAADNTQHLLGRRGFESLNRCMVGVPAAGAISDSRDSSRDEKSVGIMELMQDTSEKGDEHITKMVARVGRWWYSRCYEGSLAAHGSNIASIWEDRALLHECEMLATSFKLLICYAQKPVVVKRRAVSL